MQTYEMLKQVYEDNCLFRTRASEWRDLKTAEKICKATNEGLGYPEPISMESGESPSNIGNRYKCNRANVVAEKFRVLKSTIHNNFTQ